MSSLFKGLPPESIVRIRAQTEKLLKEVEHVRTAQIMGCVSRMARARSDEYYALRDAVQAAIEELEDQLAVALSGQVSEFTGEEVPRFRQGQPTHELEELVTAERVTALLTLVLEGVNHTHALAKLVPAENRMRRVKIETHPMGDTYVLQDKPEWEAAVLWLSKRGRQVG